MTYGTILYRVHPWTSRESDFTLSGQDDLFEALYMELGYVNLIRNILLMQWNMEVQPTSNYFLEMALPVYLRIRSC